MARRSVWISALLLGVVACGGPQRQGGSGSTCFRDDECAYGLICAATAGGSSRSCTEDVSGLISLVDAGIPLAGSAGSAGSAAGSVGKGGAGGASAGAGGKGGAGGSTAGGGAAATGGATNSGGAVATGGAVTAGNGGGA